MADLLHLDDLKAEQLASAHKQWIRANLLKIHFDRAIVQVHATAKSDPAEFYTSDAGVFMVLWYAMLFSVLEYLQEKKVELAPLDKDFLTLYEALRVGRNATFHVEKHYMDMRHFELMHLDDEVVRVRSMHTAVGEELKRALVRTTTKWDSANRKEMR